MYPNIEEYKHAIRNIQNRLLSQSFQYVPSPSETSEPYFCAGNFSVVFRVKDKKGNHFALKCFTIETKDRLARYQAISSYLDQHKSDYFVAYEYLEKELFVTSNSAGDNEFPVLKMEWVHGNTLAIALHEACNKNDIQFLKNICDEWDKLCQFLLDHEIAHGDLKHDNIVVTENNKLVLIDYDGMFVPALKNMDANEIGSSAYQHSKRNHLMFNKDMDHFSMLVIKLSLHALKHNPELFKQYHTSENIIFSKKDFDNLEKSPLANEIKKLNHPYLNKLLQDLKQSCSSENIAIPNIHQILESREKMKWLRPDIIIISLLILIIICLYFVIRGENEPNEIITETVMTKEEQKTTNDKAENKSITKDTYQIPFEQYVKFEK
ncbi:MAG: Serine/threonine protein kinase [Candidatus Magnetoglobus multicellularis str. Araruama]|uniref:Serine/threonine protein kinase n=1 Tax=Candidatus Magnetoglobus multicellularis str. Araruama TaxID=890399 RepID=A0A1V1PG61_9BACT|nr:MAG: Serine/threonine protein kinase [Candidatus Magnetoglobus multicellularis str. Araruama]